MSSEDWGGESDEDDAVSNEAAATDPEESVGAPDPTRDLPSPSVTVPDPDAVEPAPDEETETEGVDVPSDLWLSFWYLVVVFNAALLALGAGVLLVTLGNDLELGGRLLFAGGVIAAYGYYKYRTNPYRDGVEVDG